MSKIRRALSVLKKIRVFLFLLLSKMSAQDRIYDKNLSFSFNVSCCFSRKELELSNLAADSLHQRALRRY
jgi:hypothetical protein